MQSILDIQLIVLGIATIVRSFPLLNVSALVSDDLNCSSGKLGSRCQFRICRGLTCVFFLFPISEFCFSVFFSAPTSGLYLV